MLQNLHVKNIALIDDVEIDFGSGLNILTGETGAGKSILIDSVNFALGGRISKDAVRQDAQYALSELIFSIEEESTINQLRSMDIIVEDNEVIIQRRIANGKSVCRINGESVPVSTIKEVASLLIDIHGQHEHQSLLYKNNHKIMLDEFCGDTFKGELCKLEEAYTEYRNLEKEFEKASSSVGKRQEELDYAAFVVEEITNARLVPGEDEKLEADFSRMNNSKRIAEYLEMARNAVDDDNDGAVARISSAVSSLRQVAALDNEAGDLYEQILAAEDILSEFVRSLYSYEDGLMFSQEEFAACEERLDEINRLKMKYGQTIEEILARCGEESEKISRLSDFDNYLKNLQCKKDEAYDILMNVCEKVSEIRRQEAKVLEKDIISALNNLNFLDARFEIRIESNRDSIDKTGFDDIEFMISTNPGEDVKKLTNVASGGELSRIMLALKSVLAKRDAIGTLIFDEIDTGISGKTAQRVADRMSEIAKGHQVICITHLPQIASHANTHFLIEKSVEGVHTSTNVSKLSYNESVEELARMLAGEEITEAVRENAIEMKKAAGCKVG